MDPLNVNQYLQHVFREHRIVLGSSSVPRKEVLQKATGCDVYCISPDIDEKSLLTNDISSSVVAITNAKADACIQKLRKNLAAPNNLHLRNASGEPCGAVELIGENKQLLSNSTAEQSIPLVAESSTGFSSSKNAVINSSNDHRGSPMYTICSDQLVLYNGVIRGKPPTKEVAEMYLRCYSDDSSTPVETVTAVTVVEALGGKRATGVDRAKVWFSKIPEENIQRLVDSSATMNCSGGFKIDDPLMKPYVSKLTGSPDSVLGLPLQLLSELFEQILGSEAAIKNTEV